MERLVEIDHEPVAARASVELGHRELVAAADRRDRGRDAGVVRRDDLRAVAPVDLVAVVRGRVVARGDHHAGARSARSTTAHAVVGVGHGRCARRARIPAPASTRAVSSANTRELWRASWPISTPRVASVAARCALQVRGEPRADLADQHAVHPLRAGAEDAAQARRCRTRAAPWNRSAAPCWAAASPRVVARRSARAARRGGWDRDPRRATLGGLAVRWMESTSRRDHTRADAVRRASRVLHVRTHSPRACFFFIFAISPAKPSLSTILLNSPR